MGVAHCYELLVCSIPLYNGGLSYGDCHLVAGGVACNLVYHACLWIIVCKCGIENCHSKMTNGDV